MWIGDGVGLTTIVASANGLVGLLSAGALLLRPFTILRTRMLISFESDQIAASERPFGSFGEIVVTSTASAIGATAIPSPGSTTGDPNADWFVHQNMAASLQFLSGVGFEGNEATHYVVDSKAMRKVGPDDDVVLMFQEEGGFGAVLGTQGRRLIQLH